MRRIVQGINVALCATSFVLLAGGRAPGQRQFEGADPVRQEGRMCGRRLLSGFGFNSNDEARHVLLKVIEAAGFLPDRFIISAADVPNATACEDEKSSTRYILYNPEWIKDLALGGATGTDWTRVAILAHEVGHHALGHSLRERGSTPKLELEADKYAGELLAKMGAMREQALAAFRQPAVCNERGSDTHPKCADRLAAVERGWEEVKTVKRSNWATITTPKSGYTVQGGSEHHGNPIYVCRIAAANNSYLIGKLVNGRTTCEVGQKGIAQMYTDYEVLVGISGKWDEPKDDLAGALIGGQENGFPVYLCRIKYDEPIGTQPGKVVGKECVIPYGGKEYRSGKFEVFYPF